MRFRRALGAVDKLAAYAADARRIEISFFRTGSILGDAAHVRQINGACRAGFRMI
jgi:hypothetical protein